MFSIFRRREPAPSASANLPDTKTGWLQRLKSGLQKTTQQFSQAFDNIFVNRPVDAATLAELEDALIMGDLGAPMAAKICASLAAKRLPPETTPTQIREELAAIIEGKLNHCTGALTITRHDRLPYVVMVSGVNGAGKTTTIGKLAQQLAGQNYRVMIAAGDTFRAAAREQLAVWAERGGVTYFEQLNVHDPAALAYAALDAAIAGDFDVLLIDTAGRLQSNHALMEQLAKIPRVLQKKNPALPHASILILDATAGQNALTQVQAFHKAVGVTGLVITKLDGTAKGGVILPIAAQSQLPIIAIGVGEGIDDLQAFNPRELSRQLLGLD